MNGDLDAVLARFREAEIALRDTGSLDSEVWECEAPHPVDLGLMLYNVTRPSLTPVLPDPGRATGGGVVVVPGGGFMKLAMGHEGLALAQRFADRGIAAFVLKYRIEPTPTDAEGRARMGAALADSTRTRPEAPLPGEARAAEDLGTALELLANRADDWSVDPSRIGMIGFSAGAMTVMNALVSGGLALAPSFAALIYGRMTATTPPTFAPPLYMAMAADDPLFDATTNALAAAWREGGHDVVDRVYAGGGHGFGLRPTGTEADLWFDEFLGWLSARGLP